MTIPTRDARRISEETDGMFLVPPQNARREKRHEDEFVDFAVPEKFSGSLKDAQAFARSFCEKHNVTYGTVVAEPILSPIAIFPFPQDI